MTTKEFEQFLAPLAHIGAAKAGPTAYFRVLTSNPDPVLAVAGWLALFSRDEVRQSDHALLLPRCTHLGLRFAAFTFFSEQYEPELARAVANCTPSTTIDVAQKLMLATLDNDQKTMREAEIESFLATGEMDHLKTAAKHADAVSGWRFALPDLVRVVAANPWDINAFIAAASLIESASEFDLLKAFVAEMRPVSALADLLDLFEATRLFERGDLNACVKMLDAIDTRQAKVQPPAPSNPLLHRLRGRVAERQGDYKEAFRRYGAMNRLDVSRYSKSTGYISAMQTGNALKVPTLPPTDRDDIVMMLGFPRSGTTLLENALASHPQIETFEEIPSMQAMRQYITRGSSRLTNEFPDSKELYLAARRSFYGEIERRKHKTGATVFIDKMPIRSISAPLINKVIPGQKFIFSIRHPYDVAMSCFQQRFTPNAAMANFLNLVDTAKIYDIAMTNWFETFTLEDPNVCYVRYDELVTDFEATTGRVITFLGLEWDGEILNFAQKAESRATRTPSYQKVRQGLSIGVQSKWRNYDFIFKAKEAEPLTKWAKFFGYETV